ncbi:hypothetical protein L226DRAFT_556685 [Lentinus tigrinus ALCF2SS1-7]|uniref:Protein YOP1 n=1 Tax=Lentinus tigrinus ALCF2SS1-6 TaxID=1328759 RepID=A0A5C2STR5_9APHY|nr:hypothetical protein L227DRAFT_515752 [Lentinus tigrinus ALCF2SS1-6]RPD80800.1 hypothetical protein L226DRAFT_556685 [Lentinus tigrinus ALCF2SS1-7]
MPLVVPVLRLAYVFLNVFETFKTLRLPPPSARNGGQPSTRAMSARKRAMKGCMTVWIIWACFTVYERWVETFVWLFVPFYSELKSLFILFFLLTRAKGAEPVFLHVIRPLIKPYSGVLDALFDALASFGDLFVLVASIPVNYVLGFYRRWTSALDPPQADPQTWHRDATPVGNRPAVHRAFASESNGDARPPPARDVSTGSVPQTRSTIVRSDASTPTHQIWHPPASAYTDEVSLNPHSGLPTPPIEHQQRLQAAAASSSNGADEWRQYPPFPSAYPPTPLPASSCLPSAEPAIVAPRPVRPATQFSGIAEEEDEDGHNPETRQGFRRSLLLPREPRNPGSDGDLSDENHMKGVQQTNTQHISTTHSQAHDHTGNGSETEMSVDEDTRSHTHDGGESGSDMDEDEDEYNTTLRTPSRRRTGRRPQDEDEDDEEYLDDLMLTPPSRMKPTFSIDSVATRSTGLSTTDNGSSLRTRTNSFASTDPSSIPDAPSLAGKKRRLPRRYEEDDVKFSVDVPSRKAAATGKPVSTAASRASSRSRTNTVGRRRGKVLQEETENAAAEDDVPSDASSSGVKRQRVPGGRIARPKPQRGDSQGTIRAPTTRVKSSATTRPAVARAPSARVAAAARKERPPLPAKKSIASLGGKQAAGAAVKAK